MANYANLKSDIAGVIRTNNNEEITGDILQEQLLGMVDSLGAGFQYKGVATPTTAPGTPDENVFYIASTAGTYTNFGGLAVAEGEVAFLKYNGSWAKEVTGAATAAQVTQLGQQVTDNSENIVNLQQEIDNINPIVIEGNVTNAPDEEDLTTEDDKLKFADRSTAVNQKGYKILRKSATFAAQVTERNTIYEIRYAFDLGGASVTLPDNCVIEFDGGKLLNGTLVGVNSKIVSKIDNVFSNITIDGVWKNETSRVDWFSPAGDGVSDDTPAISNACACGKIVEFSKKSYKYTASIPIKSNTSIHGNGATIVKATYSSLFGNEHSSVDVWDENIHISGINGITLNNQYRGLWLWMVGVDGLIIEDCSFENHTPISVGNESQWCVTISGKNIVVRNCNIDTSGGGLYSDGLHFYTCDDCVVTDCNISTDDDCIGFVPEIEAANLSFSKFNFPSKQIIVSNCNLTSSGNCIRFETRANAPALFAYSNITISNINVYQSEYDGSLILLHDYRDNSPGLKNIVVSNIVYAGKNAFTGSAKNLIEVFGRNPQVSSSNKNISNVCLSNIKSFGFRGSNSIRALGVNNLVVQDCAFIKGEYASNLSFSYIDGLSFENNYCESVTQYTYCDISNVSFGRIINNKFRGATAGICINVTPLAEHLVMQDNDIRNYSYGFYGTESGENKINGAFIDNNFFEGCSRAIHSSFRGLLTNYTFVHSTASIIGATSSRPRTEYLPDGFCYFDLSLAPKRPIWYDGTNWFDAQGFSPLARVGYTSERPDASSAGAGFTFFDKTLGKMIVSNGSAWVNMDGTALA